MVQIFQPAPKPGNYINQFVTGESAVAPSESDLPALIIGPLFRVEKNEFAGVYDGTLVTTVFPKYETGAKIYADSVEISLQNVVLNVASSAAALILDHSGVSDNTGQILASTLTDTTEDFTAGAVAVNDKVTITYTLSSVQYTIEARVTVVSPGSDETKLTLDKSLPTLANVFYIIERHKGLFEAFGSTIKTNTVNGFASVYPNDKIKVVHPTGGTVNANVLRVLDSDEIVLDRSMAAGGNVDYEITRTNSNISSIIGLTNGNFASADTDILKDLSGVGFSSAKVGDRVRILSGTVINSATIIGIIDAYNVQLNKTFASGNVIYSVTRLVKVNTPIALTNDVTEYALPDVDDNGIVDGSTFQVLASLQASSLDGDITIKSADIFVDYRALSTKYANTRIEIENDLVIEDRVGLYDKDNPLGVGVFLACANTLNKVYAIPIGSDGNTGWLEALAIAENQKAHSLALLTQNPTYHTYDRVHVDGMSVAARAGWRVSWTSLPHPFEETSVTERSGGSFEYIDNGSDDYIRLFDPIADLTLVEADSYVVYWKDGDHDADPIIFKVLIKGEDNSTLNLDRYLYTGTVGSGLYTKGQLISASSGGGNFHFTPTPQTGDYKILKLLNKTEQAQAIANVAFSIGNRRVLYVTNATCILDFNGVPLEQPGYYYCAAYAGLSSGTWPHQPMTGFEVAGILGVRYGTEYFDRAQQGIIAAGGGWLMEQDVLDISGPKAWQQRTTDSTSVKTSEYSFTKNFDDISYKIFADHFRFPGKSNNGPEARSLVASQAVVTLSNLRDTVRQSPNGGWLGPQLVSFVFNGFSPVVGLPDTDLTDVDLILPVPGNRYIWNLRA